MAPFSKEMRKQADKNITFLMLAMDTEPYKGKIVILGGEVITTSVLESSTEVEILDKPLESDWRPKQEGARGRFILIANEFLDPAIWKQGREVTALAKVVGQREGKIGMKPYRYPLLEALEWRLWPQTPPSGHYYHDPFWDSFLWGPWVPPRQPTPPIIIVPEKH